VNAPEHMHEDAGAYLLGALEQSEREAFEHHLAGCAECRDEVERLRPAVDALPRSVEPLQAPPGLKAALMQAVGDEAGATEAAPRRRRWRPSIPRITPVVAWGAAAFLLAVGIAGGFGLANLTGGDEARTLSAKVDSPELQGASGTLSVPGDGRAGAILHVSGVPSLPGRVYQAWVQRGGEMVPQPTFEPGRDGVGVVALPDDLRGAKAVLVTREPRGGSKAPSEPPVLTVRL
jgi:anti-sigma factor RsiW